MGFANISRHPAEVWPREQIVAAGKIGDTIVDYKFPTVDPSATERQVWSTCEELADRIAADGHEHAMVMGEYTATINLVYLLSQHGIKCYVACFARGYQHEERGNQRLRTRPFMRFRQVNRYRTL